MASVDEFDLFDVAPHAKPLLTVGEAALTLDCSTDQVLALVDSGCLHAVSISDANRVERGKRREHIRLTRLSVQKRRLGQPAPALAAYGTLAKLPPKDAVIPASHITNHWSLATRKPVLQVDEIAVCWRVCLNQVRALLPEMLSFSISDQSGPRQHWRVPTVSAQAFIDARLVARNFTARLN